MNLADMNDKEIELITWLQDAYGNYNSIEFKGEEKAYLSAEFYGYHGENWVVVKKNGYETCRYSTKNLSAIKWKGGE